MTTWTVVVTVAFLVPAVASFAVPDDSPCVPRCGMNAVCLDNGTCVCPPEFPDGLPLIHCHTSDYVSCFVFGDPKVVAFNNATIRIKAPCAVNVAIFDANLNVPGLANNPGGEIETYSMLAPPADKCRVYVDATNRLSPGGQYYVYCVDIYIAYRDNNGLLNSLWIHLEEGNYHYLLDDMEHITLNETRCTDHLNHFNVCYVEDCNMWTVNSNDCGHTNIYFRPWDPTQESQLWRSGVSVVTHRTNEFDDVINTYGHTLCGAPNEPFETYRNYYKSRNLATRYTGALHAFLTNPPLTTQPSLYCTGAIDAYRNCHEDIRTFALNQCGEILLDFHECLAGHLAGNTPEIMYTFTLCMTCICANEIDICQQVEQLMNESNCKNVPTFVLYS